MITDVTATTWWNIFKGKFESEILSQISGLLTDTASSASVERVFSRFGLVHSKLRNRLGVQKSGKLVFLYKVLNEFKNNESDSE